MSTASAPTAVLPATLPLERLDGQPDDLARHLGRVLLIVNTASACGLTPQYEALQALQQRFGPERFRVLAFPSNDFGAQEPGSAETIAAFCTGRFGVSFPLFAKTPVTGPQAHPLFQALGAARPGPEGEAPRWNFTKFLVAPDGRVLARAEPRQAPDELLPAIEQALAAPAS